MASSKANQTIFRALWFFATDGARFFLSMALDGGGIACSGCDLGENHAQDHECYQNSHHVKRHACVISLFYVRNSLLGPDYGRCFVFIRRLSLLLCRFFCFLLFCFRHFEGSWNCAYGKIITQHTPKIKFSAGSRLSLGASYIQNKSLDQRKEGDRIG